MHARNLSWESDNVIGGQDNYSSIYGTSRRIISFAIVSKWSAFWGKNPSPRHFTQFQLATL